MLGLENSVDKLREEVKLQVSEIGDGIALYKEGLKGVINRLQLTFLRDGLDAISHQNHDVAIDKLRNCLMLASDACEQCTFLNLLGLEMYRKQDLDSAGQTFGEMVAVAGQAGIEAAVAEGLSNLGLVYRDQHKLDKALAFFDRAIEIHDKNDNPQAQARDLNNIASVYYTMGELQKSLSRVLASRDIYQKLGVDERVQCVTRNIVLIRKQMEK
jgi:tetratricopeptide (TPR) repeat protein